MQIILLNWHYFFVYTFYASLLQRSLELKHTPEKKCLLPVPLDDTVQNQTVIGDYWKAYLRKKKKKKAVIKTVYR